MNHNELFKLYIDLIPQYFICKCPASICSASGYSKLDLLANHVSYNCYSFRTPTPDLNKLNQFFSENSGIYTKSEIKSQNNLSKIIEEELVSEWLEIKGYDFGWIDFFDFMSEIDKRTNENSSVGFNFIIDPKLESGVSSIFKIEDLKSFDLLGDSLFSYIEIDKNFNFIDYNCINWSSIENERLQEFVPGFLKPLMKKIKDEKKLGITKTKRGDLIIYDEYGILASKRKGKWKIYEATTIKNAFTDVMGGSCGGKGYWTASSLFQLALDLSYKRHGALVVVSKNGDDELEKIITNKGSILGNETKNQIHTLLKQTIDKIDLGNDDYKKKYFPLVQEICSIDGAVTVENTGKIFSFGSIISSHENAEKSGARSTAALSSVIYSEHNVALKVSSDGEIELIFKMCDEILSLNFL